MADRVGAIVVGAGVVGLAIAHRLAELGYAPLILEGEDGVGSWTSSRNSAVVHAGIHYPAGSLKATLCVAGKALLYAFCAANGVDFRRTGKLIFARDGGQVAALEAIQAHAAAAGVDDLIRLDGGAAMRLEPALHCAAALLSPTTGIVDSHGFMLALLGAAEAGGAQLVCGSPVARISRAGGLWCVHLDADQPAVVGAPILVNSAGLAAQRVAATIDGLDAAAVPPLYLARGAYFTYSGAVPFSHLVYPVPEPGGLGIHLTLDMGGQARFGPDVEWVDHVDCHVDPGRHAHFAAAARRIWPELDPERLQPGYAGIRPKLSGPGGPTADFVISGPRDHGHAGLVNLFGIESPGLTASMAIARHVAAAVQ